MVIPGVTCGKMQKVPADFHTETLGTVNAGLRGKVFAMYVNMVQNAKGTSAHNTAAEKQQHVFQ